MKDILKILEGYGWKTESINIISQDGSYVTFEFLDEANSYEGGRKNEVEMLVDDILMKGGISDEEKQR